MERALTDLPEPLSPTMRQRLSLVQFERDAAHGVGRPLADLKINGEIFDLEEGRAHRPSFLGLKASRTASPTKTSSDNSTAMVKKPVRPSQGACRLALPCASSAPSEGEPGGRPKPRKVERRQAGDAAEQR